jgi:hypothetical protein
LQHAAGVTAGIAAVASATTEAAPAAQAPAGLLPTVALGEHRITRLIVGGNPIYGHSHFNRLYSQHLIDYHTPERVVELLRACQAAGINTWQNSFAERTLDDVEKVRSAGVPFNWLLLGKGDWDQRPELIDYAAKRRPIGIAPHGALAERLHRQNRLDVLTTLLKRIRDQGVLVGLSAHNPALIALAEEKGWDVDYYMCCLYYLTRPKEEFQKLLGPDLPLPDREIYLPSDPKRMFDTIQAARRPCLVYKVLAAGRRIDTPAMVRGCFATAFASIKPTDAVIVGMYQQFGDQVGENAAVVRELCARTR